MKIWRGRGGGIGGVGRGVREGIRGEKTPFRPAAVGSCFRRNDEVGGRNDEGGGGNDGCGVGMMGVVGGGRGGRDRPGPARFFVAGPPQNDMRGRGFLRMTCWVMGDGWFANGTYEGEEGFPPSETFA